MQGHLPQQPYFPGERNADWSITPIYNENAYAQLRVRNTGSGAVPHLAIPAVSQLSFFDKNATSAIGRGQRRGRKGKKSKRGMGKRLSLAVRPPPIINSPPINFASPMGGMMGNHDSTVVGMGMHMKHMHQQHHVKRGGGFQGYNAYGAVVTPNIIPW